MDATKILCQPGDPGSAHGAVVRDIFRLALSRDDATDTQIDKLISLTNVNGEYLFTEDNNDFIYQTCCQIVQYDFETIYNDLEGAASNPSMTETKTMYFEAMTGMVDMKERYQFDVLLKDKKFALEDSDTPCPGCGKHKIFSISRQLRRADEPETLLHRCAACGIQWTD
jgi:DNA-directed RNA polymerase subunit M/transcription elongation factor TFIIS